jgi:rSAM/selenodomain-associated transferase 1
MSAAVLIMARAPRPGAAKTRLAPLLGDDGCARLAGALLRHTASWVTRATPHAFLAFTPADADAEICRLVPRSLHLFSQDTGDLGLRMRLASERVWQSHAGPLVLIGTDAPLLGPAHVYEVETTLAAGHDACVVPALDGGYALLGLARPLPCAFALPPAAWGGPQVLGLTLAALHAEGHRCALLAPTRDLDTPDDARALARDSGCPPMVREALVAAA